MPRMTFAQAVERLKQIDTSQTAGAWEMGDVALAMVPMGTDHTNNGADEKVRVLADAAGIDREVLKRRRLVAHLFPEVSRVTSVSWSVYREIGNLSDQAERDRLVTMLKTETPDTVSGRWTVSAVRVRMGLSSILHVSEPVSEHVQRASTEERAAILSSLRDDPAVVEEANRQEETTAEDFNARQERIQQETPFYEALDAGRALLELQRAMTVFTRTVAD